MSIYVPMIGTCGGVESRDWGKFDFYHYGSSIWHYNVARDFALKHNKPLRASLFWGNLDSTFQKTKNRRGLAKECKSYEEFVEAFCFNRHFNEIEIINEFIKSDGTIPWSVKQLQEFVRLIRTLKPHAKILISEFKPWQLNRWYRVADLASCLEVEGVGIQLHLKDGYNVPVIMRTLPVIISLLQRKQLDVHFTEVSVWSKGQGNPQKSWDKIWEMANFYGVNSFTPWWVDSKLPEGHRMPTFENWNHVRWARLEQF